MKRNLSNSYICTLVKLDEALIVWGVSTKEKNAAFGGKNRRAFIVS